MWLSYTHKYVQIYKYSSFETYTRHKCIKNMTPCSMYSFQSVLEKMSNMFAIQRFILFFCLYQCKKLTCTTYSHKLLCNFLLDLLSHFTLSLSLSTLSMFAYCVQCVYFSIECFIVLCFIYLHTLWMRLEKRDATKKAFVVWTRRRVALFFFSPDKSGKWASWSRRALFILLLQLKYNQQ